MFTAELQTAAAAAITAAVGTGTVSAANVADVSKIMSEAVLHFGTGIDTIVGGTATVADANAANTTVTAFSATFKANGFNGTIEFASTAVVFPTGAVVNEGSAEVNAVPPASKLWTVTVKVDGSDANTTVEAAERILTLNHIVKA